MCQHVYHPPPVICRLYEYKATYQKNVVKSLGIISISVICLLLCLSLLCSSSYYASSQKRNFSALSLRSLFVLKEYSPQKNEPPTLPKDLPIPKQKMLSLPLSVPFEGNISQEEPFLPFSQEHPLPYLSVSSLPEIPPPFLPPYENGFALPEKSPWESVINDSLSWIRRLRHASGRIGKGQSKAVPAYLLLASPLWPERVNELDTGIVEGFITIYKDGTARFELSKEVPPRKGFAREVIRALRKSSFYPAKDREGKRMSVRIPYRCLFLKNHAPSVIIESQQHVAEKQKKPLPTFEAALLKP